MRIYGLRQGEIGHWNSYFFKPLNDWEVDNVEDLSSRLQGGVVDTIGEDKVVQMNLRNNMFLVKYVYATLELAGSVSFPNSIIWNSWVLSKVRFFACKPSLRKVLMIDWFQKKNVVFG